MARGVLSGVPDNIGVCPVLLQEKPWWYVQALAGPVMASFHTPSCPGGPGGDGGREGGWGI